MLPLILKVSLQKEDGPGKIAPNAVGQSELARQLVLVHVIVVRPSKSPLDLPHGNILRPNSRIFESIVRHLPCGQMSESLGELLT
jgi:hypothetical protein